MHPSAYNQFTVKRSGFIGYRLDNCVVPWCGTDSEEAWMKHNQEQPDHPSLAHYRNNVKVEYHRNKQGHRSSEIDEVVNGHDFNLILGDSFSEGQGVAEQELYYRHIDKSLGTRSYNMALGGTGIDTYQYNLAIWRQRVRKEPANIIVQWTQIFRTMYSEHLDHFIINGTLPFNGNDQATRFIDSGLTLNVFLTRAKCFDAFVQTLFPKSKIINLHMNFWVADAEGIYGQHNKVVWRGPDDMARDLQHWGAKSHKSVAEGILSAIK